MLPFIHCPNQSHLQYRMQVPYKHNRPSRSVSPVEVWTEHGIHVLNRVFVRGIPNKVSSLIKIPISD